jgi:Rps23 Pro-64 3,4-dihydroxylase Tpa1-like proline 4-hydroxylase
MKFEFYYDPFLIVIRDVFTEEENKEILKEAIKNKNSFEESVIGEGKNKKFRNNIVAYYDVIYDKDRSFSKLLTKIDDLFANTQFKDVLASSPYPLSNFMMSNYHETQVSRYGDEGQKYNYHIDSFTGQSRQLTMVYYFNEEPKKYKGGEISFTKSPISKGKKMDKSQEEITIKPENNMAVVFGARLPHFVHPTKSPKTFSKGRFSVNCWIGNR